MAMLIKYCEGCGERVSPEDLERESAIIYQELAYCRNCKGDVVALLQKEKEAQKEKTVKRATITAPAIVRAPTSAVRRTPSSLNHGGRPGSGERRKVNQPEGNQTLFAVLGIGCGIVAILIIFFVLSGNEPETNTVLEGEQKKEQTTKKEKQDNTETKEVAKNEEKQQPQISKEDSFVEESLKRFDTLDYIFAKRKLEELQGKLEIPKNKERVKAALEQLLQHHENEAQKHFDRIKQKVDKILAKANRSSTFSYAKVKFREAEKLWKLYPSKFEDTKFWELREEELARIKREREAKQGSDKKSQSIETKEEGSQDNTPPKKFKLTPRNGKWNLDKATGILSVKSNEGPGRLDFGEKKIKNFSLSVEFRVEKGKAQFSFHIPNNKTEKFLVVIPESKTLSDKWHKLIVTFKDNIYQITLNNEKTQKLDALQEKYSTLGVVALGCTPQSIIHFRKPKFIVK